VITEGGDLLGKENSDKYLIIKNYVVFLQIQSLYDYYNFYYCRFCPFLCYSTSLNDSTLISSIVDGDNFYVALVVGWELKQSTFCLCVRLALPLPAA